MKYSNNPMSLITSAIICMSECCSYSLYDFKLAVTWWHQHSFHWMPYQNSLVSLVLKSTYKSNAPALMHWHYCQLKMVKMCYGLINYRLINAYLLLRVNLDKIMHARWDFDASSARTRRVSALDKHQNWSASALFCLNSRAQSKYAIVNLIHTRRKQTFLSFIMW